MKKIALVLLAVLLLGIVGGVIYFAVRSDGFSRCVRMELNGRALPTTESGLRLYCGHEERFELKTVYPFSNLPAFSVRVYANEDTDFIFFVDENPKSFAVLGDVTVCFELEKDETGFTFTVPEDFTMRTALQRAYPGKEISFREEPPEADYFVLHVQCENGDEFAFSFGVILPENRIEFEKTVEFVGDENFDARGNIETTPGAIDFGGDENYVGYSETVVTDPGAIDFGGDENYNGGTAE